jgi:hypothetical protein
MGKLPCGRAAARIGAVTTSITASLLIATGCGNSASFTSQASAICTNAQTSLKALPSHPTSVAAGLELEHTALGVFTREVAQLQKLQPPQNIATEFHAGLTDDQTLVGLLSSILKRPDFVRLAITLPGHPELMPAWLKTWLAKSRALQANAQSSFAQIGVPACEKSLG